MWVSVSHPVKNVLGCAQFGLQEPNRIRMVFRITSYNVCYTKLLRILGGGLGFLAGITGIGGGIFLAPVLHILNWDNSKNIAGTCSLFILVNSLAGLVGQFMKLEEFNLLSPILSYWAMFPAVLVGGQIGSSYNFV